MQRLAVEVYEAKWLQEMVAKYLDDKDQVMAAATPEKA